MTFQCALEDLDVLNVNTENDITIIQLLKVFSFSFYVLTSAACFYHLFAVSLEVVSPVFLNCCILIVERNTVVTTV